MRVIRDNLGTMVLLLGGLVLVYFLFFRPSREVAVTLDPDPTDPQVEPRQETYKIVTLLPRDAIPAIDEPQFYTAEQADAEYVPDELVLGVSISGEQRAYSTSFLDGHEIVNDNVGGRKIAVTW